MVPNSGEKKCNLKFSSSPNEMGRACGAYEGGEGGV